ncbi:CDP-alcohol phosphatidyltransferase family protein [Candidatus Micrarchaeota archaeon]|nr:MAG: CDP-alcohol phosphatidyltransferase family protein [Candidatus Micrarchaeota archaeon]
MLKSEFAELAERASIGIGIVFSRIPITPNAWTVLSIVPALAGFWLLVEGSMPEALGCFALSALLDVVDGGVARVTGRVTALGAYLDGMIDRLVEALLLFGLMLYGVETFIIPGYAWAAVVLFSGTVMTSYARAYAEHRKALDEEQVKRMPGFLERAERLVIIFAGMVAGCLYSPLYLSYALALAALLASITVIQRISYVIRTTSKA